MKIQSISQNYYSNQYKYGQNNNVSFESLQNKTKMMRAGEVFFVGVSFLMLLPLGIARYKTYERVTDPIAYRDRQLERLNYIAGDRYEHKSVAEKCRNEVTKAIDDATPEESYLDWALAVLLASGCSWYLGKKADKFEQKPDKE